MASVNPLVFPTLQTLHVQTFGLVDDATWGSDDSPTPGKWPQGLHLPPNGARRHWYRDRKRGGDRASLGQRLVMTVRAVLCASPGPGETPSTKRGDSRRTIRDFSADAIAPACGNRCGTIHRVQYDDRRWRPRLFISANSRRHLVRTPRARSISMLSNLSAAGADHGPPPSASQRVSYPQRVMSRARVLQLKSAPRSHRLPKLLARRNDRPGPMKEIGWVWMADIGAPEPAFDAVEHEGGPARALGASKGVAGAGIPTTSTDLKTIRAHLRGDTQRPGEFLRRSTSRRPDPWQPRSSRVAPRRIERPAACPAVDAARRPPRGVEMK